MTNFTGKTIGFLLAAVFTANLAYGFSNQYEETAIKNCVEYFKKNKVPETRFLHDHELPGFCKKVLRKAMEGAGKKIYADDLKYYVDEVTEENAKDPKALVDPNKFHHGTNYCATCHSMQKAVKNYTLSAHGKEDNSHHRAASCVDCHIHTDPLGYPSAKLNGIKQMIMTYHGKYAPEHTKNSWDGLFDMDYYLGFLKISGYMGLNFFLELLDHDLKGGIHGEGEISDERRAVMGHHVREKLYQKDSDTCKRCHSLSKMELHKQGANAQKKHAYAIELRKEIKKMRENRKIIIDKVLSSDYSSGEMDEFREQHREEKALIKKYKRESTCIHCHGNFHQQDMKHIDESRLDFGHH